jgi:cytoskeleton protein RodZ
MAEQSTVLGLAAIRKNRGITLEQISNITKISVRTLEAIEHGEFAKLPGGIYDTNYIRQYARAIDYDESAILAVYRRERPEAPTPQPSRGFFSSFRGAISITG